MRMLKLLNLLLTALFIILLVGLTYSQTVVQPVLTLDAPGYSDQDDMCIWIHPEPSQSTIIASDKSAKKLFVYDLSGNVIQTILVPGEPGNIDIRYNFLLSGQQIDIVAYNDKDNDEIIIYKVDPLTRQLSLVNSFDAGNWPTQIYGICLYLNHNTGKYYAFAGGKSGQIRQWELVDNGDGTIGGVVKRTWLNGSSSWTEGLVADDENGKLYAANEEKGVYKYNADPINPIPIGELIASTGDNGLSADVEGITLYYAASGEGYLLVSSQGSDNYKVYERKEPHHFIKTVVVNGVNNADGIDVTNLNLGIAFSQGLFLTHDGTNPGPYSIKGCKYQDLGLTVDVNYWNPRNYPLPVELVSFSAVAKGNKVILNWETATEVNNYGFEIHRRANEDDWITLGFVDGHGNSNSPKIYSFSDNNPTGGTKFSYRLKQIDNDGTYEYSDIVEVEFVPTEFALYQNYPNPFNPTTKIKYSIPRASNVTIKVFDILGEEVITLVNEKQEAGTYNVDFDGSNLDSGIYIYQMQAEDFSSTKKMLIIK